MKTALLAILCLGGSVLRAGDKPATADANAAADFVRFQEDAKGAQLQTAITTYRNGSGVAVELIGAIHIADKRYYDALNKRFTTCEVLLYEMVGEDLVVINPAAPPVTAEKQQHAIAEFLSNAQGKPNAGPQPKAEAKKPAVPPKRKVAPKPAPPEEAPAELAARNRLSWLHPLYDTLKNTLKLEGQMDCIDYSKQNFVHADMTARQLAFMQEQRGEGFLQMWWRSVQAQIAQPEATASSPGLLKILEILCRPDSPTELKRLLARMFDQVENIMSGVETEQGSVILVERNKVALEVLKMEMANGRKHLGIFYGAAHLPDMEQRLLAMGFKREKVEWLTAWDLPPEPPPVKAKSTPAVKPAAAPVK